MNADSSSVPEASPTSGLAIASLICGLCGFVLLFVTGIPAIIMGHMALNKIKASNGAIQGRGIALAGTILGYFTTLLLGLIAVIAVIAGLATPAILKAKKTADRIALMSEIQVLAPQLQEFHDGNGRFPTANELPSVVTLPKVKTSEGGDWVYFPEADVDEQSPLLISPAILDTATVLWTDLNVSEADAEEISTLISESKIQAVQLKAQ